MVSRSIQNTCGLGDDEYYLINKITDERCKMIGMMVSQAFIAVPFDGY